MSIGKVTTWFMTEEERLAYIKKHPIIPTGKTSFSTEGLEYKEIGERKKAAMQGKKVMDGVNEDKLHKLFMAGKTFDEIAAALNINVSTLNNFIKKQRDKDPEKWPYRAKNKLAR